jgi:dihydropteroate synthase
MAILNATPDSFSGDGIAYDEDALVMRARTQREEGAGILDIGGESTRPGSVPVPLEEELRRVIPSIRALAEAHVATLSIDTSKPEVADAALRAGARILNDVSGLADPRLASVAADHGADLVLMHNGWTLEARGIPDKGDPVERVVREIERLALIAERAGVPRERLIADPGIGFGKTPDESLALIARTAELCRRLAPLPLLVGPSRKGFIGHVLDRPAEERLEGTLACVAIAAFAGAAIIRVHDVRPAVHASRLAWSLRAHAGVERASD